MGKRLHTLLPVFTDDYNYDIEIYDNEWTDPSIVIDTQGGGTIYRDHPAGPLERPSLISRSAKITMLIQNQDHEDFIADFAISDEGRFYMKIIRDGVDDFIGILLSDQTELENTSPVAKYEIGAVDGLTMLKNVPYQAAQGQAYIDQNQTGKFHVNATILHGHIDDLTGTGSRRDLWATIVQDVGDNFDAFTGEWGYPGTYDIVVYLSILGYHNDFSTRNSGPLTAKLIHIDANSVETTLDEQEVEYDQPLGQRRVMNLGKQKVVMLPDEQLVVELSWDFRTETDLAVEVQSFFENKLDLSASVVNVYDSIINHCSNLLQQLPTYSYYDPTNEFFGIYISFTEDNQGAALGQDYIGIPYNAFTKNLGVSPPDVISVYDALIALAILLNSTLKYNQGRYYMQPHHHMPERHAYLPDFSLIGLVTDDFSESPMECIGTSSTGYLAPVGEVKLSYNRVGTKNLLSGVESQLSQADPGYVFKKSVSINNEVLYFSVAVRLLGEESGSANADAIYPVSPSIHRHNFEASLRFGTDYVYIYNRNEVSAPLLDVIYNDPPELTVTDQKIAIWGKPKVPTDIVYELVVTFILPPITFEGDLEFTFKYKETIIPSGPFVLPEPLNYEIIGIKLRRFNDDDIDKLYNETIVASVTNRNNSLLIEEDLIASDLWEVDTDPGAIKVWDGAEWVRPALWDNGDSYHMTLAKWIAAKQAKPTRLHSGAFRTWDAKYMNVEYEGVQFVYLTGSYNTILGIFEGQWVEYITTPAGMRLDANIYIEEAGQSRQTNSINNLSQSPLGSGSGAGEGEGKRDYELYIEEVAAAYVDIPADKDIPNTDSYTVPQLMRIFNGCKKGSGDLAYREVLTHPSHFNLDYANRRFNLFRAPSAGDQSNQFFFMWSF